MPASASRVGRYIAGALALAAAYYAAGKASLALQYTGPVAAIWLPVGIAAAALYLGGLRWWPGVVIGDVALADMTQPVLSRLGQTAGNLADILVIAVLLRRLIGPRGALDRIQHVGAMLVAITLGGAITATVATVSLQAGGVFDAGDMPTFWRSWFLADVSGSLVVIPLVLAWAEPRRWAWDARAACEWALMFAAIDGLTMIALSSDRELTYIVFPVLIWAVLRFERRGATLAVAASAAIAVWITARDMGPFVEHSITDAALSTQLYIAVAGLTTLCLAAIVAERRQTALDLATSRRREEQRVAEERARIARDLHDSVSQSLFSTTLHLRTAERALLREGPGQTQSIRQELDRAGQLTRSALADMRELLFELHPDALGDNDLATAIVRHAAAVSTREDLAIDVQTPGEPVGLTRDSQEQLLLLVQEALANVVKHAEAKEVEIDITRADDGTIAIDVRDDGRGFDPASGRAGGFGLTTMRSRAAEVGGQLKVTSAPGRGTIVRVEVPPAESESHRDG